MHLIYKLTKFETKTIQHIYANPILQILAMFMLHYIIK